MGCNASKLPPNTVVEVPTSVAPRASANANNSPAKTMSDESFLNRLDDCLDSSNFENMKENNSFKSPESIQMKKTNIVKSRKVVSISISPVGSQSSSLNESLNSFETKILFEETEDCRQEEFENNANPLRSTEENKQKPITKTINPKTINVEMPTKENESVPFHNLQRGRSLKLFDIPTPPNQVMGTENICSSNSLKYIDKDVEYILESTIQSARKIQRRAEEYLSSSHLDVRINFDQIDTITKNSIRKMKGHNVTPKLAASSKTSHIKKKITSNIAPYIEDRAESDAEEQRKQNYLDDFKVSDLSIISKASPYTPKHPSKKLHRVLGNLIADDNCMAERISNAREKYLKERQKRIQMEKMISASAYFSPKSRIRKTPDSYIGKRNVTLRELR